MWAIGDQIMYYNAPHGKIDCDNIQYGYISYVDIYNPSVVICKFWNVDFYKQFWKGDWWDAINQLLDMPHTIDVSNGRLVDTKRLKKNRAVDQRVVKSLIKWHSNKDAKHVTPTRLSLSNTARRMFW